MGSPPDSTAVTVNTKNTTITGGTTSTMPASTGWTTGVQTEEELSSEEKLLQRKRKQKKALKIGIPVALNAILLACVLVYFLRKRMVSSPVEAVPSALHSTGEMVTSDKYAFLGEMKIFLHDKDSPKNLMFPSFNGESVAVMLPTEKGNKIPSTKPFIDVVEDLEKYEDAHRVASAADGEKVEFHSGPVNSECGKLEEMRGEIYLDEIRHKADSAEKRPENRFTLFCATAKPPEDEKIFKDSVLSFGAKAGQMVGAHNEADSTNKIGVVHLPIFDSSLLKHQGVQEIETILLFLKGFCSTPGLEVIVSLPHREGTRTTIDGNEETENVFEFALKEYQKEIEEEAEVLNELDNTLAMFDSDASENN